MEEKPDYCFRDSIPRKPRSLIQSAKLREAIDRQVQELPPSRKDRLQWQAIQQLDWDAIAGFYSMRNATYCFNWDGEVDLIDASLSNIKRLMDTEVYFSGAKHLIVHLDTVKEVVGVGNGQVKLILSQTIPVETKLSRVASQQFKKWVSLT